MPLTSLGLKDLPGLTGEGLGLIKGCPLTSLSLADCGQLVDAGIEALVGMPLTYLDVSRCARLSDASLTFLCGQPLTNLQLDGIPGISCGALFSFLDDTPTLKDFEMRDIESVSLEDEADFWKARYLKSVGL